MSADTGNKPTHGFSLRGFLGKLSLFIVGYLVAVAAATVVTVALVLLFLTLTSGVAQGASLGMLSNTLSSMLVVGFFWTLICAWPGFIVAVITGELVRWQRWHSYALAGLLNALTSLIIFADFVGSPLEIPAVVVASFPGGFAGGLAYWHVAGRFIANRRRLPA